jgi:hypothetical protein
MRILAFAMLVPLAACGWSDDDDRAGVSASGTGGTRSYAVADFTTIEQRGPDDVDVHVGSGFSVRAEGESDVLDRIKIVHDGKKLRITRVRSGFSWHSGAAKIYVTMPRIEAASLAGSGDISVDRVEGTRFDGNIAGAGSLALRRVSVASLTLSIAGAGNVQAAGEARSFKVSIAGSGDVDAAQLRASEATVDIAGSGDVRAVVDGDASISIMGAGNVDLGPKARCKVKKMGSGDVRCGG